MAPVHAAGTVGTVIHRILDVPDALLAIVAGDKVKFLEIIEKIVAAGIPDVLAQRNDFFKSLSVDIDDSVSLRILLISPVEEDLCKVSLCHVAVYAANFRLGFRKVIKH